jgi:hypothetical protein
MVETSFSDMLVAFHLAAFFLNELATPQWQKNVRDISREVVAAMRDASSPLADEATFFAGDLSPRWGSAWESALSFFLRSLDTLGRLDG